MAVRKAPAVVMKERDGKGGTGARDHELEHCIEEATPGEGGDPRGQHDPLAPNAEEEGHREPQDGHHHGRAEQADRVADGVPGGCGMCVHPVEQRHVELREWVMVDDVLRDAGKDPQPREANGQPNREVEPEVFAARKPRGHEGPRMRIALLEALERGPGEEPLPHRPCTLDEPGAVPLKPAPPERQPHDESDEQRARQAGLTDVVLELRQVATEHEAERAEDHGPANPAQGVIEHEGAVRHARRPREHGDPGAQQRDEAADEDRLGTVPLKKAARAFEVRFVEVNAAPIAPHQRDAALPPDPIAAVVADDGRGDRGRHDRVDREVPQGGQGGCREQGRLARERDPEAFQGDQEKQNDVAVGCNQARYRLKHGVARYLASWGGRTATNPRYSSRSYTIFRVPAMKKGTLMSVGRASMNPAKTAAMAAPVVRATPVMPAAADRSSGRTTAMMYDCLVGTSIWLMLKRASNTRMASGRVGISGTRMSRRLEGRCVNTMVLTRPKRAASRDASSAETPANRFAQKKMMPSVPGFTPNRR